VSFYRLFNPRNMSRLDTGHRCSLRTSVLSRVRFRERLGSFIVGAA
jgi:hypothetical protein